MMPEHNRVLVIEDERAERNALARLLRCSGYEVLTAASVKQATEIDINEIDLIISDLRLGTQTATDLLRNWRDKGVQTPFLFVTAFGDVSTAVAAMKLGAVDYLTKPVDPNHLLELIGNTIKRQSQLSGIGDTVASSPFSAELSMVWSSQTMDQVMDRVRRAAQTESIVLVLGESGTGKELVAQAIHHQSSRSSGPFVAINIAAIPRELVESELFGHMRGAFTGATGDRQGKFELATHGTLFIDEVGDFELAAQAKILRVLESRIISPVGSNEELAVDARIIAATSRNLPQMVQDSIFREDLYYRLSVVVIEIPPLRERRDDITVLAERFVMDISRQLGRDQPDIHPELMNRVIEFDWPGNVRQLRNAMESMIVMSDKPVLRIEDFPSHIRDADPAAQSEDSWSPSNTLEALERQLTLSTLRDCSGNRTRAAECLGISVRTLQRRLKSWGIQGLASTTEEIVLEKE